LHYLLLFFDIFFLILYDLNRKHTIFSSIGQKVWPREIPQFLARKLKHHPSSELGALEVEFEPLPVVWWDAKFDSTQKNFKSTSIRVRMQKDCFTEARPGYGSGRQNMTRNQNRVRQKLAICDGNG
jgi:hypothetical protein